MTRARVTRGHAVTRIIPEDGSWREARGKVEEWGEDREMGEQRRKLEKEKHCHIDDKSF